MVMRLFSEYTLIVRVPDGAIETHQRIHETAEALSLLPDTARNALGNWVAERVPGATIEVTD